MGSRRPLRAEIQEHQGAGSVHRGCPLDSALGLLLTQPSWQPAALRREGLVPTSRRLREARCLVLGPTGRDRHCFPAPPESGASRDVTQIPAKGQTAVQHQRELV